MAHHYIRNTIEATKWCNKCGRPTRHKVSDRRIAHCLSCAEKQEEQNNATKKAAQPKQDGFDFGGRA